MKTPQPDKKKSARKGNLQVDHPTVLVISDDVEFSRSITARWQMERHVPTFTMLSGDLWPRSIDNFAVAIVGPLRRELLSVVLEPLHSTQQPLFCVCQDAPTAQLVRERWPRTSVLRCDENWLERFDSGGGRSCAPRRRRSPRSRRPKRPAPRSNARPCSAATCWRCATG